MKNEKEHEIRPLIYPSPEEESEKKPIVPPIIGENQWPEEIPSDVQGSYTGVPEDGRRPIQDADDL